MIRRSTHRSGVTLALAIALLATCAVGVAWAAWRDATGLQATATAGYRDPVLLRVPHIAGTPTDGETLTAVPAVWSRIAPTATRSYQWYACPTLSSCGPIASTLNGSGESVVSVPVGAAGTLRYVVEETVTNGTNPNPLTAASLPTQAQAPFDATVLAVVRVRLVAATTAAPLLSTSAPTQGSPISVTSGTWTSKDLLSSLTGVLALGAPSFSYQWYRCDAVGNTGWATRGTFGCTAAQASPRSSPAYTPVAADARHRLRARVIYTRSLLGAFGITLGTFVGEVMTQATDPVPDP